MESFETVEIDRQICYQHIGALFTDIVLQAGLNYQNIVRPRVQHLLFNYPDDYTRESFEQLIAQVGLENLIRWRHPEKLRRMRDLLTVTAMYEVDSCIDFKVFLGEKKNREKLLEIKGFGPKTIDYTLKLLNFDTVAVDRHIYSFVEMANIPATGYNYTKQVVEYAADFLQVSRSAIDYSIWLYMSQKLNKKSTETSQLQLVF
ncbi:HhH-GDP family DNA glycosylase [Mucilaginibacter segetis]|uniref:Uncharacterized protein n=1 Tax=Mucilaginibacter segetis TaxID=2793071 RepID=A0A934UM67_9SPHI|nr:hypothetical protein [Mucilaginibacter segetis]MBK0378562.1 hypothetical protein [Mucilaginibacter segetis]